MSILTETIDRVTGYLPEQLRATLYLRMFGLTKVRMLFLARPKVEVLTEERAVVRIPLNSWTKNHVGSMYIAALAMGADVAGGMLAMEEARKSKARLVPIFKDFWAEFHKRAEGDVLFTCEEGGAIREMVARCVETGERQNLPVNVSATVHGEEVARFVLTLSVKVAGQPS